MRQAAIREVVPSRCGRPHSVLEALERGDLRVQEGYILLCETDHLFLKPLPNLASVNKVPRLPLLTRACN